MEARHVVGVDSSTQSCKALLVEADSGRVVRVERAAHPDGTEVAPASWHAAMDSAAGPLLDGAAAVAVAGQQHGLVTLDSAGRVVRKALLWNDVRAAPQARDLIQDRGAAYWFSEFGMLPDAALTVAKLAWIAQAEPRTLDRTAEVVLPHDWLTGRLLGRDRGLTTDASEASGTGYYSPRTGYARDLLAGILGKQVDLPTVLSPTEPAGRLASGALVAPGAADNAAAAFGLDLQHGEVVVSLGTSGTVFTRSDRPLTHSPGIANFLTCTGDYLPLVCTLNAARVLTQTADLLGISLVEFDQLALNAPRDADGMLLLPYLDGERWPRLPGATGTLVGMRRSTMAPGYLAQAVTLGMLCGLADALDALLGVDVRPQSVLLIGGAAQSMAVRAVAPAILGCEISLPAPREYVALGAARQAAWTLAAHSTPPAWGRQLQTHLARPDDDWGAGVRARYREAQGLLR